MKKRFYLYFKTAILFTIIFLSFRYELKSQGNKLAENVFDDPYEINLRINVNLITFGIYFTNPNINSGLEIEYSPVNKICIYSNYRYAWANQLITTDIINTKSLDLYNNYKQFDFGVSYNLIDKTKTKPVNVTLYSTTSGNYETRYITPGEAKLRKTLGIRAFYNNIRTPFAADISEFNVDGFETDSAYYKFGNKFMSNQNIHAFTIGIEHKRQMNALFDVKKYGSRSVTGYMKYFLDIVAGSSVSISPIADGNNVEYVISPNKMGNLGYRAGIFLYKEFGKQSTKYNLGFGLEFGNLPGFDYNMEGMRSRNYVMFSILSGISLKTKNFGS